MRALALCSPKTKTRLVARAWAMRNAPTDSELLLWRCLSAKKLGVAFKRQVPLGGFVVDLLAPGPRLVIEIDGGWHNRRVEADARQDRALCRWGYRVLRLEAELVLTDLPEAVARVRAALAESGLARGG